MPNLTRFSKYALVVLIVLLTVALWRPSELPPKISEYLSQNGDGLKDGPSPSELLPPSNIKLPFSSSLSFPKFGKITATFGEPDPPYENAIASHKLHNEIHGYPHFILRERMLRGLWSKHAYIMTIIGNELAKPKDERLAWVLWHDRDTVLMNPQIPLDIFVPPSPAFDNIHMLVTNDRNGLNNGVFLCRVSSASFKFFASALSIREYQPEIQLKYTEQSGMEEVVKRDNWNNTVAYVPQRWFNGFPPTKKDLAAGKPSASRPGSLLIHFASNRDGKRPERMAHWSAIAKKRTAAWDKPVEDTGYAKEIMEYWERLGKGESQQSIIEDIEGRIWD
ncbi:glycosyltransferase family 34 protein [Bipolaris victoriae FI3]|uniref:Glycosyltransferase family 34 protein n=1 Tax=Bipolaris victoriae (strain FI3) TaxID=930091 RepID=W7E9D2_BIPV3|nr:glycosyltransferase family 34 protein [Bipolaris victoriae FI3]